MHNPSLAGADDQVQQLIFNHQQMDIGISQVRTDIQRLHDHMDGQRNDIRKLMDKVDSLEQSRLQLTDNYNVLHNLHVGAVANFIMRPCLHQTRHVTSLLFSN